MSQDNKKDKDKKTLIEKIEEVYFEVHEDSLHKIIEDALKVSKHIAEGKEANFGAKELIAGTLDVVEGAKKVLKNKEIKEKEDKDAKDKKDKENEEDN